MGSLIKQLGGSNTLACLVLVSFFLLFLGVCYHTWRMTEQEVYEAGQLPLDSDGS